MVLTTLTIQDILPCGSNKSNIKKVELDAVLPFIILPALLIVGTLSQLVTIIVLVFIGMAALYVHSRPRQKNRSVFFFSWTISSGIYMFLVFELRILRQLEITHLENFVFIFTLLCSCFFFYKMKAVADFELATGSSKGKEYSPVLTSDSHYCQICQIEVNERFFHSIWWNCCVFRPNYMYFLAGQVFAFFTLTVGTVLSLTTICQPYIVFDTILMPEDCSDVYYDFDLAMCFVVCLYGVGYLLVVALVLVRQMFKFMYSKI